MKMVSQLTRQAMSRHRLLSAVSYPEPSAVVPPAPPFSSPHSLYAHEAPAPQPPSPPPAPATAQLPQQRTIYGELMKKHDRFTERHLTGR